MHDNDGLGARGDLFFHIDRIEAEPLGFAFAKNRHGAQPDQRENGCPKSGRRHQHFISWLKADRPESGHQRRRAVTVCKRIGQTRKFSVILFQLTNHGMS